ncbi:D-3-phosphoglycerate dehydrogenase [Polystyrenella longa]|uniref:D-3-phosphoglycerate dehydrogenase n=1 Tax=Polystyrenella longa TaxID=2528007 RepID=A0A518CIL5_9PLAN|nr:phosphoglycerate dehydrogenase [Polystyrenella longa]QDU79024.1 D-3-phosphoglycerate dehydrogenase [Polystyrenella longa]
MYRVLITDNLSPAGLEILNNTEGIEVDVRSGLSPEEVREALKEADGIIIRSATKLTPELLEGQPRLKVIVRAGVGVDNIDLPAATREGIVVMNTPAGNTISTAEHAVAMMMALSRNIAPAAAGMKEGKWDRKKYTGTQLAGKTIGVIGLGRIGLAVAARAQGLEMKVVGFDPFLSTEKAAELGIGLYREVDDVVKQADYLTVHTPLTDETRDMLDAARLAKAKKGVRIINCARGGIVNENDLADAIESGHVAGAALDVFTKEPPENRRLVELPQVLTTPHLGASTDEAQELVAVEAADLIATYLTKNEIRHAINMAPISGAEMESMKLYLDLAYRLGLTVAQMNRKGGIKKAKLDFRGEAASKNIKLMTSAFSAGMLESALAEKVNIVNAEMTARERGIQFEDSSSEDSKSFSTLISATLETDSGDVTAAGTIFGNEFLRLVRLGEFQMESYLDGNLLVYRHLDVPGLIGYIGTICGKHNVNIANMALGRAKKEPGGDSVAVLNLDSAPSDEVIQEIAGHEHVQGVELLRLPPAGAPLPWLGN